MPPCVEGTIEERDCGSCGVQSRTCHGCDGWGNWNTCVERGACTPGDHETEACGAGCASRERTCSDACGWTPWTECPDDQAACNDQNPCTVDNCRDGACQHERRELCCADDSSACPSGSGAVTYDCVDGVCVPRSTGCATASDCDDVNPCTDDRCVDGACRWDPRVDCCLGHSDCDDGEPCTEDVCTTDHTCEFAARDCTGRECSTDGCCGTCNGGVCSPDGRCVNETDPCAAVPHGGACEGDVLVVCAGGRIDRTDCAVLGRTCGLADATSGQMSCIAACSDATPNTCVGDDLYYCEAGVPAHVDCKRFGLVCGMRVDGTMGCKETTGGCPDGCPSGAECVGGQCVPRSDTHDPGGADNGPLVVPDEGDSTPKPGATSGGGCAVASSGSNRTGGAFLLFLLATFFAIGGHRKRRPRQPVSAG